MKHGITINSGIEDCGLFYTNLMLLGELFQRSVLSFKKAVGYQELFHLLRHCIHPCGADSIAWQYLCLRLFFR